MIQHIHSDYFDIFKFVCILENWQVFLTTVLNTKKSFFFFLRVLAVVLGLSVTLKSAKQRNYYESLPTVVWPLHTDQVE